MANERLAEGSRVRVITRKSAFYGRAGAVVGVLDRGMGTPAYEVRLDSGLVLAPVVPYGAEEVEEIGAAEASDPLDTHYSCLEAEPGTRTLERGRP